MRGLGKRIEVRRRPELVAVPPTGVRVHAVGGDEEQVQRLMRIGGLRIESRCENQ